MSPMGCEALLERCISVYSVLLPGPIHGHRAFLPSSCYGFCPWQGWVVICAVVRYLWILLVIANTRLNLAIAGSSHVSDKNQPLARPLCSLHRLSSASPLTYYLLGFASHFLNKVISRIFDLPGDINSASSLSTPVTSVEVAKQIKAATDPLTKQLNRLCDLMKELPQVPPKYKKRPLAQSNVIRRPTAVVSDCEFSIFVSKVSVDFMLRPLNMIL